jgi:NADPH:quinone reductase-like Zn-dependent oxidoreductase
VQRERTCVAAGNVVIVHGAAGGVGSIAVQLAREVGARVIGTGRADDRDVVIGFGAQTFLEGAVRRGERGLSPAATSLSATCVAVSTWRRSVQEPEQGRAWGGGVGRLVEHPGGLDGAATCRHRNTPTDPACG